MQGWRGHKPALGSVYPGSLFECQRSHCCGKTTFGQQVTCFTGQNRGVREGWLIPPSRPNLGSAHTHSQQNPPTPAVRAQAAAEGAARYLVQLGAAGIRFGLLGRSSRAGGTPQVLRVRALGDATGGAGAAAAAAGRTAQLQGESAQQRIEINAERCPCLTWTARLSS
jgi:hypothetical protein